MQVFLVLKISLALFVLVAVTSQVSFPQRRHPRELVKRAPTPLLPRKYGMIKYRWSGPGPNWHGKRSLMPRAVDGYWSEWLKKPWVKLGQKINSLIAKIFRIFNKPNPPEPIDPSKLRPWTEYKNKWDEMTFPEDEVFSEIDNELRGRLQKNPRIQLGRDDLTHLVEDAGRKAKIEGKLPKLDWNPPKPPARVAEFDRAVEDIFRDAGHSENFKPMYEQDWRLVDQLTNSEWDQALAWVKRMAGGREAAGWTPGRRAILRTIGPKRWFDPQTGVGNSYDPYPPNKPYMKVNAAEMDDLPQVHAEKWDDIVERAFKNAKKEVPRKLPQWRWKEFNDWSGKDWANAERNVNKILAEHPDAPPKMLQNMAERFGFDQPGPLDGTFDFNFNAPGTNNPFSNPPAEPPKPAKPGTDIDSFHFRSSDTSVYTPVDAEEFMSSSLSEAESLYADQVGSVSSFDTLPPETQMMYEHAVANMDIPPVESIPRTLYKLPNVPIEMEADIVENVARISNWVPKIQAPVVNGVRGAVAVAPETEMAMTTMLRSVVAELGGSAGTAISAAGSLIAGCAGTLLLNLVVAGVMIGLGYLAEAIISPIVDAAKDNRRLFEIHGVNFDIDGDGEPDNVLDYAAKIDPGNQFLTHHQKGITQFLQALFRKHETLNAMWVDKKWGFTKFHWDGNAWANQNLVVGVLQNEKWNNDEKLEKIIDVLADPNKAGNNKVDRIDIKADLDRDGDWEQLNLNYHGKDRARSHLRLNGDIDMDGKPEHCEWDHGRNFGCKK